VNECFSSLFEDCGVENIITTTSDHYAILISLRSSGNPVTSTPVQHGFKYEAMWRRADDYAGVVESAWNANRDGPKSFQAT
jgi:hypothetical protein